jgi:hypothetical protein
MSTFKTPFSSTLAINGHLFLGAMQTITAVSIWPSSPEWWGFGLLSVLLGLSAFANLIAALRKMVKVYGREKEIARLAMSSRQPEPSDLAGFDAMKNAGMFND